MFVKEVMSTLLNLIFRQKISSKTQNVSVSLLAAIESKSVPEIKSKGREPSIQPHFTYAGFTSLKKGELARLGGLDRLGEMIFIPPSYGIFYLSSTKKFVMSLEKDCLIK